MTRFQKFLLSLAALLVAGVVAHAANITPTPIVPPTETGENSLGAQQVTDTARLKVGSASATCAVSAAACSATINAAAGIISFTSATAGASGTAQTVATITDSKVQAGDMIQCTVDQNGVTAGAVISCFPHITATGTFTINLADASVTAMTSSSLTVWFLINTQGNPN